MLGNSEELANIRLKCIVFPKFKIHAAYAKGKELRPLDSAWSLGVEWSIDKASKEHDFLQVITRLCLHRKSDNFTIAELHTTATYEVSKCSYFNLKYNIVVAITNMTMAQLQGAWRAKVYNPSLAIILPQAYNKVVDLETDIKKMIYEEWE